MTTNVRAINAYSGTQIKAGVHAASPHRLVQMLLEGALTRLDHARGAMQRGEIATKGEKISSVITIVEGLQANLDRKAGAQIAENLADLYSYISRTLVRANAENNLAMLDDTATLLRQIKHGWDGIEKPSPGVESAQGVRSI